MRRMRARVSSWWRALRRPAQLDAEMHEEMRFHIEMEAERLASEHGLDAREARRRAHIAFGGVEKFKEEGRDARGRQWLDAISLDARLGVRMLVRHRWLTLVGGFAMTVAIAIGATFFEVITEMLDPALPLKDGARVVALQLATENPGHPERRVLHDFVSWREQLVSIRQLGAFRTSQHNLASGGGPPEPIKVAEITASAFVLAGTPPLLGRYLLPSDEADAAPRVLLIGHDAWQSRWGGDPHIVGRLLSLGGVQYAVVGVMPDGFGFPVDHQFWTPLRVNPLAYERMRGPELYVFGRLAPGFTLEASQAELTTLVQRAAAAHPETHARLRPLVLPYTREHLDLEHPAMVLALRIAQLLIGALSFVVAVNLAILLYARTVTRLGEIAVRTALGASRLRILAQLFVEALALTLLGATVGLALARTALDRMAVLSRANGTVPFWLEFDLSAGTVIYAFGLAVLAAVIMGVAPGLKATGSRLEVNLHELATRTGTRLGPMWTTLVVSQVAVAVAVLPVAAFLAWQAVRLEIAGPGFAAERFVVATVALGDRGGTADSRRARVRQLELLSRLRAEPGVSAVTFSSSVPGFAGSRRLEFEDAVQMRNLDEQEVSTLQVDVALFDVYGIHFLAGRAFEPGDLGAANVAIVNRTFAQTLLQDRSAPGVRFRYSRRASQQAAAPRDEWYQIVGVVQDFPAFPPALSIDGEPVIYHPAAPGDLDPMVVSMRFSGNIPPAFSDRVRGLGAEVDAELQVRRVVPLSRFYDDVRSFWRHLAWGVALVTVSVLLLSAAGIYALMSFTVTQRTREIGIRAALGAAPHRLLFSIFGRVARQLALGVLAGSLVSGAVFLNIDLGASQATTLLLMVAAIMLAVGLLAAVGPARRGLRIDASEALRSEG